MDTMRNNVDDVDDNDGSGSVVVAVRNKTDNKRVREREQERVWSCLSKSFTRISFESSTASHTKAIYTSWEKG